MVYEIPFLGGVADGDVRSFSELCPWWQVAGYPPTDSILDPRAAVSVDSHVRIESYRLGWWSLPMLDVNWEYAVYVCTELKEPLPVFVPNGTYVRRRLGSRRARVISWLAGLQRELDRQQFLEADTELDCWSEGDTELES